MKQYTDIINNYTPSGLGGESKDYRSSTAVR